MKRLWKSVLLSVLILSVLILALPVYHPLAAPQQKTAAEVPDRILEMRQHIELEKGTQELSEKSHSDSVEANALPYSLETSRTIAGGDDVVWFTVTSTSDLVFLGGYLCLYEPVTDTFAYVDLIKISPTTCEGYLYINNFMEPASYTLEYIHMTVEDGYYIDDIDQAGFLIITATVGDAYPALNISFDQAVYWTYDTAKIRISNSMGLEDLRECQIYFSNGKSTKLVQQLDGSYSGELMFSKDFGIGFYDIEKVEFSKSYEPKDLYKAVFYSTEFAAGDTSNYQDFSAMGFELRAVRADVKAPVFNSITATPNSIPRNGEVAITVGAMDAGSGVETVEVHFHDWVSVFLKPSAKNYWKGVYQPNPFNPTFSPVQIDVVGIKDKASNAVSAFPGSDFTPISINISGYPYVGEIYGSSRYKTAVQISRHFGPSNTVILASGTDFPDALAAGPLAKVLNAPILLTKPDTLPAETLAEIKRRGAVKVLVLGGPSAISDAVINTLTSNFFLSVRRIAGSSRYATALKVADELEAKRTLGSNHSAILTSGADFPDALSVGSWAANQEIPILLNPKNVLRTDVKAYLQSNKINKVQIIGGPLAISDAVKNQISSLGITVERISGSSRYNTSVAVAKKFFGDSDRAFICNGTGFADALAAAPLAGKMSAPLLLVQGTSIPSGVDGYLRNPTLSSIGFVTVVGGAMMVSSGVKKTLNDIMLTMH